MFLFRRFPKSLKTHAKKRNFTSDSLVYTTEGLKLVKDLIGKPFVANVNGVPHEAPKGFWEATNGQKEKNQDLYHMIILKNGMSIELPASHYLQTPVDWIEVQRLSVPYGLPIRIAKNQPPSKFKQLMVVASMFEEKKQSLHVMQQEALNVGLTSTIAADQLSIDLLSSFPPTFTSPIASICPTPQWRTKYCTQLHGSKSIVVNGFHVLF
jgi:hypothetical protein